MTDKLTDQEANALQKELRKVIGNFAREHNLNFMRGYTMVTYCAIETLVEALSEGLEPKTAVGILDYTNSYAKGLIQLNMGDDDEEA